MCRRGNTTTTLAKKNSWPGERSNRHVVHNSVAEIAKSNCVNIHHTGTVCRHCPCYSRGTWYIGVVQIKGTQKIEYKFIANFGATRTLS